MILRPFLYFWLISTFYRVTFQCRFPITADVTSEAYDVIQDVTTASVVGEGNWLNAFNIAFTESDYSTPFALTDARIGDTFYVAVNFVATSVPVSWFVTECSIEKVGSDISVKIVKNTCYSEVIQTGYGGARTSDASADKIVTSQSKFQERS